jgi:hypothetical protein
MSTARLLYWIAEEVRKRGRVKVGELATLVGLSYQYFRHSVVKQLIATYDDIELTKEWSGGYWVEYLEYKPKKEAAGVDQRVKQE